MSMWDVPTRAGQHGHVRVGTGQDHQCARRGRPRPVIIRPGQEEMKKDGT